MIVSDGSPRPPRAEARKVDRLSGSVNLALPRAPVRWAGARSRVALFTGLLALGGCLAPLRPVPLPVPPEQEPEGSHAAPAEPVEAWRVRIGNGLEYGITVSGPAVLAATTNRVLVAHATEDGHRFWGRRYSSPLVGTPVRVGERLYFGTGYRDRKVHALELERGRAVWERRTGEARTSVVPTGDVVYAAMEDGRILALALEDGTPLWERRLPGTAAWTPVVRGDQVLVGTYRDTLYALEAATGIVRARAPLPGTPSAPPLLAGDTLYLPLHPGTVAAVALDGELPILAWLAELADQPVLAAPIRGPADGLLLLDRAARLWSVDTAGGARLLADLGGTATESLARAAQGAVVGRLDGALFLLDGQGSVLWRADLGGAIVSPAVVRRDGLYVPLLDGHVVKLR